MPEPTEDNLQRLEEIVAYLDGELSPEESARVERRLASDESYRQQLQGIKRAWAALDELPQSYVDERFSRTTMEMAVKAAASEVQERTMALPVMQRRRRLSTLLAACAAAALGFLLFRLAWHGADRALLADLPVIDNVDIYTQFDSPKFLRTLQQELGDDLDGLGCLPDVAPERIERLQTTSLDGGRREWINQLDDEERTSLRAKFNRFQQLQPGEQARLRELHADIAEAPDADKLQHAMLAYSDWLGGLPPARQFELRTMPSGERVAQIERWADEMRDDALFTLTDDELRRFVHKIREPHDELLRNAARNAARDVLKSDDSRKYGRGRLTLSKIPNAMAMQVAAGMSRPGEFQEAVLEALPERMHDTFTALPPRQKVERIMTWMRQSEAAQGEISQEALERFFADELDAETRAELLRLPPGEMEQALRRLYRAQPGRGFGKPWAWGRSDRREMGPGRESGPGPNGGPGRNDHIDERGDGRRMGPRPDGPGGPGHGPPDGPRHWEGRPGGPGDGPGPFGPGGPPPRGEGFGPPQFEPNDEPPPKE